MTFDNINEIKKVGFTGFVKMSDLFLDSSMIPDVKGVYFVLNTSSKPVSFLKVGSGGHFKGKNPNVLIQELESNWVENTNVVYIGKATSLKKRLGQYFNFGQGRNTGHYGGRLIWQLANSKELIVCWKETPEQELSEIESKLIQEFKRLHNEKRPFANLKN